MTTPPSIDPPVVEAIAPLVAARRLADTLIYEGYLLYPYRASSSKNQVRWQWGVLAPPGPAERLSESAFSQAECLVEPRPGARLIVEVRFLQLQARTVEILVEGDRVDKVDQVQEGGQSFTQVESLMIDGVEQVGWDEGAAVERDFAVPFEVLLAGDQTFDISADGGSDEELLYDAQGQLRGRFTRRRWAVQGQLRIHAERLPGPYGVVSVRVVTENVDDWNDESTDRADVMRRSLLGAHSVLACSDGQFLSMLDPPQWAAAAVAECVNERVWPVLVGEPGDAVVLCSPIILYDYPQIAPESPGDLYDSLEIDEILSLRTMTLTDEEKRQARATDPRAAAIIDRVEAMSPDMIDRLHGAVRYLRAPSALDPAGAMPWELAAEQAAALQPVADDGVPGLQRGSDAGMPWWDPGMDASVSPETDSVVIEGVDVRRGSKVRLMPGRHRRTDAQDTFLVGRLATVQAVLFDVDDVTHLAVTVDDDPMAELQQAHGRFLYFQPDELEPEVPS